MSDTLLYDSPITPDDILKLSHEQGATCMYTKAELEKFPQMELDIIFAGIQELNYKGYDTHWIEDEDEASEDEDF